MYLNELAPKKNILKFIPEHLLSDELPPQTFYSLENYLKSYGLSFREYIGFITGASEMQETVFKSYKLRKEDRQSELPKDDQSVWFPTSKVEDIRVFFRNSKSDTNHSIGSKVRLYSWGKPYKKDNECIQHLDSGFLTFARNSIPKMIHQNALASTVFYQGLYAINGPASVRKLNVPAGKDDTAPSYKMVTYIKPSYSEDIDKRLYDHILTPAGIAAGIEDPTDFFGTALLDDLVDALTSSVSFNELIDRLRGLPDSDLDQNDIDRIIDRSNSKEENLSDSDDFDEAPGLNIVATLDELASILEE